MNTVQGEFTVTLTPQTDTPEVGGIGRMLLEKVFSGGLDAKSTGYMLGVRTKIENSAGYVAMDRVEGELEGKKGTFYLQHSGSMDTGQNTLSINIVPDSGTGELEGIAGTLDIAIEDGKHSYTLTYTLS